MPLLVPLLVTGCPRHAGTAERLAFAEIPVAFRHVWGRDRSHFLVGAAVLDVEGDGRFEVFVGGGEGQADALLRYAGGRLVDVSSGTGLAADAATYGATSLDVDADGDVDLFAARRDGLTLHENRGGRFAARAIPLPFAPGSAPVHVAVADVDRDGDADLHVCAWVPRAPGGAAPSPVSDVLLLGDGVDLDGAPRHRAVATRRALAPGERCSSVFVDLDADRLPDLVVARSPGRVEIRRNRGDAGFERVDLDVGTGLWRGIAVGDPDRDGDPDLFVANAGRALPRAWRGAAERVSRLRPLLLRNEGGLRFADVTEASGLSGLDLAWGAAFEDLDVDGALDLLAARGLHEIAWLRRLGLRARAFTGTEEGVFRRAGGAVPRGRGIAPVVVDLDGGGRPDLLWLASDGPARAFVNLAPDNFVHAVLPDSLRALGSAVHLEGPGRSATRWTIAGSGLGVDHAPSLVFGIGEATRVARLVVRWPDRRRTIVGAPELNRPIPIR